MKAIAERGRYESLPLFFSFSFSGFLSYDASNLQFSIDRGSCSTSFAILQVRSTMDGPNFFEGRLDIRVDKSQPIVIPNPSITSDNLRGEVLVSIIYNRYKCVHGNLILSGYYVERGINMSS
jgi:hypothetical protein